jgi:alpha-glucosidase
VNRSPDDAGLVDRVPARRPGPGAPWWREAVLYENHLPSLRDGNGDGTGDLHGLIDSLDYLGGTLGISAVWVGPFFRSPLLDQGFDISDHKDVEPLFGDLATVDRLIAEAHSRGVRIVVDYVPNHTSDQHPWFLESRSARENPKRDWYVWADARPGEKYPNNWISEAGGSVWEYDEPTGQFYLHSHLVEQPDLNWRNPEVRAALFDVLRFWLDRGVDGFRIDVAHMLMKDPELRDNPPNPGGAPNEYDLQHPGFTSQLHVNDRLHPDLHGVLRMLRGVLDEYDGDRVSIGEVEAIDWDRWAGYFGEQLDGLHLPFAFQLIETPWAAAALADSIVGLERALPEGAWPIFALGNHDRPRLASRIGRAQARVGAMLLLTLRGTPTIFYGDELGMVDQEVPRELQRDYFGLTAGGVSRDPTRTPMPWNDGPNGGYAPAAADSLWLPIAADYRTINVEAQLRDPASMLNLYCRLIATREASDALRGGAFTLHPASDECCLVYLRADEGDRKLVALNLTSLEQTVACQEPGTIVVSTALDREGERVCTGEPLRLRPDEGVIVDLDLEVE